MLNAKELVRSQIIEIEIICDDLLYIKNDKLRNYGLEQVKHIVKKIEENLEYLEDKQTTEEQNVYSFNGTLRLYNLNSIVWRL